MDWFPEDLKESTGPGGKAKNVYFAGCTASYVEHDIGMATVRLLDEAGVDFMHLGEEENCCGTPMLVAGKWELFAEIMKHNIELVKEAGADTVITSCPACDMMWRHVYPEWAKKLGIEYAITGQALQRGRLREDQGRGVPLPQDGQKPVTVTWHDSCHIGRVSGVYEPPRDLIKAIPNVKFVEMEPQPGAGPLLRERPHAAQGAGRGGRYRKDRLDEAVEAGAEKVLALCPCCEFQLRVRADKKAVPVEVRTSPTSPPKPSVSSLPDPNPEVREQWAVFEAMIELMTPQGFADLMGTMWPELIDAMPLRDGPMMRFMGKIPGA